MTAGSITVPTIVPLRAPANGKLKNVIDTCTPIELKTETPNAEIFFTVDGSKPDPFAALGADRSTIKYTKPFKLREGKKTVKAVALSRDGARESHVVTKCFEVERCKGLDEQENKRSSKGDSYEFIDELEKERKKEIIKKRGILKKIVDTSNLSYRSGGSLSDNESSRYHRESPFLGKRFGGTKELSFTIDPQQSSLLKTLTSGDTSINRRYIMPDSSSQTLRLQRETDFLKCIYCFATRPHDPHARFCTECGKSLPQLPQNKMVQPSSGKLGTCFFCKSTVPTNTTICIICENPINPHLQPETSSKLQGKVICIGCKTANPSSYASCVACDAKLLPNSVVHADELALAIPQHPNATTGKSATCSQCFRINRGDARFCDWCGSKPQKQLGPLACGRCGASNHPVTKFCIACGTIIQPPNYQNANAASMGTNNAAWLTNIDSKAAQILNKQYSTIATQTYGLFYTSAKALENKTEKELRMIEKDNFERRPTLTAVSAGKGYWRQQMDHICTHLKVYAQNNAEFRAIVGEPRLGKLNSAKVDIDSNWCTVTATFPIRNHLTKEVFNTSSLIDRTLSNVNSKLSDADYEMMAAVTAARDSSAERSTIEESNDSDNSHYKDHVRRKPRKPRENTDEKLSGEDRQLAKELSKAGRGRPQEVEDLLNEGANPNAVTKDGLSMLHQAIRNRHLDCIPVLLHAKADIKATVPPKKNTVLHEAVLLGSEAGKLIKLLLDFGANPAWKNAKNETAFDLAIKENNTAAINALGAHVGEDMVKTYLRAKPGDIRP